MKGKILIFAAVSAMSCACSNQVDELGIGEHLDQSFYASRMGRVLG